ncbi:beta-glucosidase 47 [Quercus suber]|uniref:Beta-glucosidase 47 n=1 Tax=Quercus suber TaxID=58331 RepID=A0AAW0KHQ5_QUESU
MASLGVNSYRFSISWARILPKGKLGDVNLDGINFYNKLIDGLLHKGIQPFVTLTHFDIPQELEEKYGGWLSPKSRSMKIQKEQEGSIGIVLHAAWFEPISNSTPDKLAAERAQSFFLNWFLDPIIFRDYPAEMKEILGSILPEFSSNDREILKNGLDFIGINQYTSYYVQDCISSICEPGPGTDLEWLNVYPLGMEKMVTYVMDRYNNIPMFITENGYGEEDNPNITVDEFHHDVKRVEYMNRYLDALLRAVRKGADVRGYFAWSLLDNFEWNFGYTIRFGLHYVDYTTLKRTPKLSASWYKQFIAKHMINPIKPKSDQEQFQY